MSLVARITACSPPARRTLALVLLALAMALVWVLVVIPLRTLVSSQDDWRQRTSKAVAEDRGALILAESLKAAREGLNGSTLPARLYVTRDGLGPDAQLEADLRAALTSSGVEPTNFKTLPAAAFRGLRTHRVEFASNMTVDQLQAFLLALEAQPRQVRIERLQLSAPGTQRMDENPHINLLFEAHGFSSDAAPAAVTRVANAN